MKKLIATVTAAALALAGAVAFTPASMAHDGDEGYGLTKIKDADHGWLMSKGSLEQIRNKTEFDLAGEIFDQCFYGNPSSAGNHDEWTPADAVNYYAAEAKNAGCPNDMVIINRRDAFNDGTFYWDGFSFTRRNTPTASATLYPGGRYKYKLDGASSSSPYGNFRMIESERDSWSYDVNDCAAAGAAFMADPDRDKSKVLYDQIIDYGYSGYSWGYYQDYPPPGDAYTMNCQIKTTDAFELSGSVIDTLDQPNGQYFIKTKYNGTQSFNEFKDDCKRWSTEYAEKDTREELQVSLFTTAIGITGCETYLEIAGPPKSDADCQAGEMHVNLKDQDDVCFPIPTARPGSAEDVDFNAQLLKDGADTGPDPCGTESYIGGFIDVTGDRDYHDWMRENMALQNYSDGKWAACEERIAKGVEGDEFYGLKSITSYDVHNEFFMVEVEGVPLCKGENPVVGSLRAAHCDTPIYYTQSVSGYVNTAGLPDSGWDPDLIPDLPVCQGSDCQVTVELPTVPASQDYEFAYEQGEAGVCLYPAEGEVEFVENGVTFCGTPVPPASIPDTEPIQEPTPPPPPECWQGPNNCPVGQSMDYTVPKYMMVGVPVNVTAYATRTVESQLGRFNYGQPDNGTAVIHYGDPDSPPVAGVPFVDGQATFRVVPQEAGKKNFSICGVLNSGTSGGNAYIECVEGETTVLPYDPEAYRNAFKAEAFKKGETFTIADKDQAKGKLAKRLEWRVAQSDEARALCTRLRRARSARSSTRPVSAPCCGPTRRPARPAGYN